MVQLKIIGGYYDGLIYEFENQSLANDWVLLKGSSLGEKEPRVSCTLKSIPTEALSYAKRKDVNGEPILNEEGEEIYDATMPSEYELIFNDITKKKDEDRLIRKGVVAQQKGAEIMALVFSFNELNLKSGFIDSGKFQNMLNDSNLLSIERVLWNGSLLTAKYLINSDQGLSNYFTKEQIILVNEKINVSIIEIENV